jgi:hypothetical protein
LLHDLLHPFFDQTHVFLPKLKDSDVGKYA